jgi:hypothetical protein
MRRNETAFEVVDSDDIVVAKILDILFIGDHHHSVEALRFEGRLASIHAIT